MRKLNLTYKQQFLLGATLFLLVLWLVFQVSVKPTLLLKANCKEKEKAVEALSSSPQRINQATRKLENLNHEFRSFSMGGSTARDLILEEISQYCNKHNISVYNYPESHISDNNKFVVETNRIVLKSNFKRLLKLVHFLEGKAEFGKIISLHFYTEENRKTKKKNLFLELIIQNIKTDEDTP
jgi:hypothetical protein